MYRSVVKPLIDFFGSFLFLVTLSPILLFITIILTIQNGGTPFFFQVRPGRNQKAFKIIKFKTMTDERGADGNLLPDVQRITRLGKLVRNFSLDELLQLINVLKGDMSLVGPRPLLYKYISLYSPEQNRRHEVRPGITGWAQVNGRNAISWTRKFELDIEYVERLSLKMDLQILYLTILKVFKREGVNQSIERPMEPFNGVN